MMPGADCLVYLPERHPPKGGDSDTADVASVAITIDLRRQSAKRCKTASKRNHWRRAVFHRIRWRLCQARATGFSPCRSTAGPDATVEGQMSCFISSRMYTAIRLTILCLNWFGSRSESASHQGVMLTLWQRPVWASAIIPSKYRARLQQKDDSTLVSSTLLYIPGITQHGGRQRVTKSAPTNPCG